MNPKLLIVTDLGLLKAYKLTATPNGFPHLDLLEEVVLDEAHHRLVERVTDFAGRHAAPTHKKWGAPMSDGHNLKLETRRRLIKQIVGHVERLVQNHKDCGVWLAADREINSLISSSLLKPVRQRIETNLALDLVHANEKKLIKCFAPHLLAKKPEMRRTSPSHHS